MTATAVNLNTRPGSGHPPAGPGRPIPAPLTGDELVDVLGGIAEEATALRLTGWRRDEYAYRFLVGYLGRRLGVTIPTTLNGVR